MNNLRVKLVLGVRWLSVLCSLMVASCEQSNNKITAPHSLASVKTVKPGAAVTLGVDNLFVIGLNSVETINVVLNVGENIDAKNTAIMHVDLNPGEGLQITKGAEPRDFVLGTQTQYPITVDLKAASAGRYYLNLQVVIENGESKSMRNLAVIIQVGPSIEAKNTLLQKIDGASKEGVLSKEDVLAKQKVISLPAQEEIINQ
jgi:hypothetical protein